MGTERTMLRYLERLSATSSACFAKPHSSSVVPTPEPRWVSTHSLLTTSKLRDSPLPVLATIPKQRPIVTPLDELVLERRTSLGFDIASVPHGVLVGVPICTEGNSVVRVPLTKSTDVADDKNIIAGGCGLGNCPVELHGGGMGAGWSYAGDWDGEARGVGCGAAVALCVLLVRDFLLIDLAGVG